MFTILHVTDLHRAASDPISNAELESAMLIDRDRYCREKPPIGSPDAIVVSGDIIQGVGLNHPASAAALNEQYAGAEAFLVALTDRFVGGDRTKVVIVPGNHDVDWNVARAAMSEVGADDALTIELPKALHEVDSSYRWDWRKKSLLTITDRDAYSRRLEAFWRFFSRFYDGCKGLLRVEPWSDANLYALDEGRIGLAAFNSCRSNDCFAFHGEVSREAIAQAHLDLRDRGPWKLMIAVWHHDVEGPPHRTDYMDPDIVRGMIGRGFRLGLYGHQHRTQITPMLSRTPENETMAIASAGSLCAGARDLPPGSRRGYSIVEIGDDYSHARIHVREMAAANLFSRAHLAAFGGASFVDLEWSPPQDAAGRPSDHNGESVTLKIAEAETALVGKRDPHAALKLLSGDLVAAAHPFGRKILFRSAQEAGDLETVIALARTPQDIDELVAGVEAAISRGNYGVARDMLSHSARLSLPTPQQLDLAERISIRERLKT